MIKNVKTVSLIKVDILKGDGTEENPVRIISEFWDYEENMIFEIDSLKD